MDIVYIIMGSLLTILGLMGFRLYKKKFEFHYADITGIFIAIVAMVIGILLIISAIKFD